MKEWNNLYFEVSYDKKQLDEVVHLCRVLKKEDGKIIVAKLLLTEGKDKIVKSKIRAYIHNRILPESYIPVSSLLTGIKEYHIKGENKTTKVYIHPEYKVEFCVNEQKPNFVTLRYAAKGYKNYLKFIRSEVDEALIKTPNYVEKRNAILVENVINTYKILEDDYLKKLYERDLKQTRLEIRLLKGKKPKDEKQNETYLKLLAKTEVKEKIMGQLKDKEKVLKTVVNAVNSTQYEAK